MPYPEPLVAPMRAELSRVGVVELKTPEMVDDAFDKAQSGTMLLVVNSVCGCAAANARPAVTLAMQAPVQPDRYTTVFAGQDLEATARARDFLAGIPPSSPFIALIKNGEPAFVLERRNIEGRSASAIAMDLVGAFNTYCGEKSAAAPSVGTADAEQPERGDDLPGTFRSIL
ncbi:MAG: BrxA/BrxB family bacilliredoxin [Rhodothermales bacterium]